MADKEQDKPTEDVPKKLDVPDIEVTEGASGGTKDNGGGKKGFFESLAGIVHLGPGKRSKSKSPEPRKDNTQVGGESSKRSSPLKSLVHYFSKPSEIKGDDEEMGHLCEQEVTPHANELQAPKKKDMVVASPSPAAEPMAEKCDTYNKSSSVSSAPSCLSSLPDDDTDIASPDDPYSPDDGKQK